MKKRGAGENGENHGVAKAKIGEKMKYQRSENWRQRKA
jgi:hypothetical protein